MYAHWKDGKMTLTFEPLGGELPEGVENPRRCWIGQPFGELPVPTYNGYKFLGWYEDLDADPLVEVTEETIAPEENLTVYAIWEPDQSVIITEDDIPITTEDNDNIIVE